MPLVWELTAEIRNWLTGQKIQELNVGWRMQHGGYSDAVINDLVSILERPGMHYEALLGYLQTQFLRQRGLSQEYHGLDAWLVELVYYLLYYRQVNNNRYLHQHLPYYDGIRALVDGNEPLWVFTLNHDLMIETIAARQSIPVHAGFSASMIALPRRNAAGNKTGEIRAEVLTRRELDHGAMHFPNPPQAGINLLKVHGALDIFTFNDGEDLLRLLPDAPGQDGVIDVLRAANEDLFYPLPAMPGGRAKTTNEITYADNTGEMQFLRRSILAGAFKFDTRRSQVLPQGILKHFSQNLNLVSSLICIGYGFGDRHINAVLREWLEFSPTRYLEIVNPNAKEVPSFLLHLTPQILLIRSSATDYFDSKAGIVRSEHEKLQKRVSMALHSLGKEEAREGLNSFARLNQERLAKNLSARLASLPTANGQPDFSGIGDPLEVAKQWGAEMKLAPEKLLRSLAEHLEGRSKLTSKANEQEHEVSA